ncbi:hypothetical protein DID80_08160 [Candidatus Marinamargulisbacteria bacterium SCGC AAA071-K20]|nr:hypothetical protein DID80_08160 [Candidatus Marinamargulisbacteria bacterium SCGC AAA071-K20]
MNIGAGAGDSRNSLEKPIANQTDSAKERLYPVKELLKQGPSQTGDIQRLTEEKEAEGKEAEGKGGSTGQGGILDSLSRNLMELNNETMSCYRSKNQGTYELGGRSCFHFTRGCKQFYLLERDWSAEVPGLDTLLHDKTDPKLTTQSALDAFQEQITQMSDDEFKQTIEPIIVKELSYSELMKLEVFFGNDNTVFCGSGEDRNTPSNGNYDMVLVKKFDRDKQRVETKMYMSKISLGNCIYHSSLSSFRPVLFAGGVTIEDGALTGINNTSGHYEQPEGALCNIYEYLEGKVELSQIKTRVQGIMLGSEKVSSDHYLSVKGWNDHQKLFGMKRPIEPPKKFIYFRLPSDKNTILGDEDNSVFHNQSQQGQAQLKQDTNNRLFVEFLTKNIKKTLIVVSFDKDLKGKSLFEKISDVFLYLNKGNITSDESDTLETRLKCLHGGKKYNISEFIDQEKMLSEHDVPDEPLYIVLIPSSD